ncbi:hypothetical protein JRQ81_017155 [Phrynocephalus forsythii]|uniref:Uncharacterized protein n=1 Tax=Phrynocephalus forsythii TaxID=171643 RepID=A0A9Q0XPT3_9SAUR|nr:hypothetical protein JRQ81_017155 [Phrynocephalus forsythii]
MEPFAVSEEKKALPSVYKFQISQRDGISVSATILSGSTRALSVSVVAPIHLHQFPHPPSCTWVVTSAKSVETSRQRVRCPLHQNPEVPKETTPVLAHCKENITWPMESVIGGTFVQEVLFITSSQLQFAQDLTMRSDCIKMQAFVCSAHQRSETSCAWYHFTTYVVYVAKQNISQQDRPTSVGWVAERAQENGVTCHLVGLQCSFFKIICDANNISLNKVAGSSRTPSPMDICFFRMHLEGLTTDEEPSWKRPLRSNCSVPRGVNPTSMGNTPGEPESNVSHFKGTVMSMLFL